MQRFQFRWKNFRCFQDTEWQDIKPLTIFIGPNNSGKTSLILPFLLMKQSIESLDLDTPLKIKGDYVDLGSYKQFVFNNEENKNVEFDFRLINQGKNKELDLDSFPRELNLIFKKGTQKKRVRLNEFIIKNHKMEDLLKIKLRRDLYKIDYYKFKMPEEEKGYFANPAPNNFLFLPEPLLLNVLEELKRVAGLEILPKEFIKFISIISISKFIQDILERIDFVGPFRKKPERIYDLSGDRPRSVGHSGGLTPEVLWYIRNTDFDKHIRSILTKYFGVTYRIIPIGGRAPQAFRIVLKDKRGKLWTDFADVGFGYSQLLPIVVQGLFTQEDEIFIAEQPEIHLNPKVQSQLGDFFVYLTEEEKKFVILETHSEHILLRIRTLIAEGKLDSSKVALYFVQRDEGVSEVKKIEIQKNGHIQDEDWLKEFFDDTVTESLRLASAQRNRYRNKITNTNKKGK